MQEVIVDYNASRQSSWLRNKCQGMVNRYCQYRRNLLWRLHLWQQPAQLDASKLVSGSMPVFINNFNRYRHLKAQMKWLSSLADPVSVIIIDNNSTYPPLLAFYETLNSTNVQVVKLGFNSWRKGAVHLSKQLLGFDKFIITDPDLLPCEDLPKDVLSHLSDLLDRYPAYNHIGLSLEINDLPDNPLRETVRRHESKFWPPSAQVLKGEVMVADVDTTFAIYRNGSDVEALSPALRTVRPYTLRHLDWYIQPDDLTEEYRYYLQSVMPIATWSSEVKRKFGLAHLLHSILL
ncbi:MAG: hypothetical protein IPN76_18615 [Saprospiraceae bacterium]|nr:hypothetical protein [Saprospiraceae bacterium]